MKINTTKTKNDILYYLTKNIRYKGKTKTITIEKLGKHSDLIKLYPDPLAHLKEYAKIKTIEEKSSETPKINFVLSLEKKLSLTTKNPESFNLNIGYFYLQSIIKNLSLKTFFKNITKDTKIEYNPYDVTRFLTYARILDPKSKHSTHDDFKSYYEQPDIKLQDIYKTLDLISDNLDSFQSHLYENSKSIVDRNTSVLYYDLTNYYFETEYDDDFRKYGKSKEHRPNPIVQMGLFMDSNGVPLAFSINPGNVSEQSTVKSLENKIIKDFKLSKFIYCADAGLGSLDNRLYNSYSGRGFIVTQSLKKLKKEIQSDLLSNDGWTNSRTNAIVNLSDILDNDKDYYFKEDWIDNSVDIGFRSENYRKQNVKFKNRIIVTYSKKYEKYNREIRENQINRAINKINSNSVNTISQTDSKRLIKTTNTTEHGEIANDKVYELDLEKINYESKFDGFYAVATNLDDDVENIIKVNNRRWQIEECFRIMKTNFKARPVFHYKKERIEAHFAICFLSLLVYRLLESKLNTNNENHYTINEIINNLKSLNVTPLNEAYYKSNYSGSLFTDELNTIFNMNLNLESYLNTSLNKQIKKNI